MSSKRGLISAGAACIVALVLTTLATTTAPAGSSSVRAKKQAQLVRTLPGGGAVGQLGSSTLPSSAAMLVAAGRQAEYQRQAVLRFLKRVADFVAAIHSAQQVQHTVRTTPRSKGSGPQHSASSSGATTTHSYGGSYGSVMQCIKDHESGVYTRNNHGYSGASGAYQIIRSTWKAWASKVGVSADAAYLASPADQDKVVQYMLANGGASNWSPRFGNDPCTVGMGG